MNFYQNIPGQRMVMLYDSLNQGVFSNVDERAAISGNCCRDYFEVDNFIILYSSAHSRYGENNEISFE